MVRLSSRWTPIVRRYALPVWLSMAILPAAYAVAQGGLTKNPWNLLIATVFVAGFGYLLHRQSKQLVDSVYDCGSFLQIQRDELVDRIPLEFIAEISTGHVPRSTTIVLQLSRETAFGVRVSFIPRYVFVKVPIGAHPIAKELLIRAAAARASSVV